VVAIALLAAVSTATARLVAVHSDEVAAAAADPVRGRFASVVSDPSSFKGELLVWASGGFSTAEVKRVRDSVQVAAIAAVRTGLLAVESNSPSRGPGYRAVPVEAMAANREAYAAAVGRPAGQLSAMLRKGAVLSQTSARLRKLRSGGRLRLVGGRTLRVTGVVPDWVVGGYEVAVDKDQGRQLHLNRVTYLLLRPRGPRPAFEAAIRRLLPRRALRFQTREDRPFLRPGDGVLPLAQVKLRFGEFAVRSLARPDPDPRWVRANIVRGVLPVLGPVRCHRLVVANLAAAMGDLQRMRLERLVDVADFRRQGGCWQPRPPWAGGPELSRHLWGIAVGLDVAANPSGARPVADPRLVRVMASHGFTWGGRWLRPEGGQFEWVGSGA